MPDMARSDLFTIDRELCIGSGVCLVYAPQTFAHDEAAKVTVVDPTGDSEESIRTAVEGCPTRALTIAGEEGES